MSGLAAVLAHRKEPGIYLWHGHFKDDDVRHTGPRQIVELALVEPAIGGGDVEQPVHHILENLWPSGEQSRHLPGIGIEASYVALGIVEHLGNVLQLLARNMEHALEGGDLVRGDDSICLGHLGSESDHADGEGDGPLGRERLAP